MRIAIAQLDKGGKTEQFISQLASSLNINIIAGYLVKHYNKAKNISDYGNSIAYSGHSSVYDPCGNEILIADNKESINICHLQIEKVLEIREKYPFLKDRKTDNDF